MQHPQLRLSSRHLAAANAKRTKVLAMRLLHCQISIKISAIAFATDSKVQAEMKSRRAEIALLNKVQVIPLERLTVLVYSHRANK